jgi:hypothetical protein
VALDFGDCATPQQVTPSNRDLGSGGRVTPALGSGDSVPLDLATLGGACLAQNGRAVRVTVTAAGLPAGVQLEGGLSANQPAADALAARLGGAY